TRTAASEVERTIMADPNYGRGMRDRYDRERSFTRQQEQFDTGHRKWSDDEARFGQMGDDWRAGGYGYDGDYGYAQEDRGHQRHGGWGHNRGPSRAEEEGVPRSYWRSWRDRGGPSYGSFRGDDIGGHDFNTPQLPTGRLIPATTVRAAGLRPIGGSGGPSALHRAAAMLMIGNGAVDATTAEAGSSGPVRRYRAGLAAMMTTTAKSAATAGMGLRVTPGRTSESWKTPATRSHMTGASMRGRYRSPSATVR